MVESVAENDVRRLEDALAAAGSGDMARAMRLAEKALADGLEHPLFFKLRGARREQQGRLPAAIADFQSALAVTPEDFAALNALGHCLARTGRSREGLASLDAALALAPDYAPIHANRGWVLENLGDIAGARAAYLRTLELDPRHLRALGTLAFLAARAGDAVEARAKAEQALALDPHDAVANVALGAADLEAGDASAAERRLRAVLTAPALTGHIHAVAFALLGDALDRLGRTDEAFAAYASGNRTLVRLYGERPAPGEAASGLEFVNHLRAYFRAAPPAAWRRGPAATSPAAVAPVSGHAFVLGFPRSGTTLLGQVLAAHPQVVTLDEQETLAEAANAFMTRTAGLDRLADLGSDELDPFRSNYWSRVLAAAPEARGRLFVDKLPMNTLGLPLIAKLFPDAKAVFVRRDPRDVVLSCFRRQFVVSGANREFLSLEGAARFYDAVMDLADIYAERLDVDLRVLRYESLVADFEGETRGLCDFIGLDWTPAMGDFAKTARSAEIATPSAGQLARGLYAEGVGQWRRYRVQLEPVLPLLAPWVERFGYEMA